MSIEYNNAHVQILDEEFVVYRNIDDYESFIWTERYNTPGEFELYLPCTRENVGHFIKDEYVRLPDRQPRYPGDTNDHLMVIETIEIDSDSENGDKLLIKGRSLESILDRRVIWGQIDFTGTLVDFIEKVLNENFISPEDTDRTVGSFIFVRPTDEEILSYEIVAQYYGENVLDVIEAVCKEHELGFCLSLNNDSELEFQLYSGKDRSYNQTTNPYVIFNSKMGNIVNSNYIESNNTLKNVTFIFGDGEVNERITTSVGDATGLERREITTDASGISMIYYEDDVEKVHTEEEYKELLTEQGNEILKENNMTTTFDGDVENYLYKYGDNFFMGDIVQIENQYGKGARSRITELVISHDVESLLITPSFEIVKE